MGDNEKKIDNQRFLTESIPSYRFKNLKHKTEIEGIIK